MTIVGGALGIPNGINTSLRVPLEFECESLVS